MKVVTALVKAGANVNYVKPSTNLTALHWAAFNNDREVIQYLLTKGAVMKLSAKD
jgi:ankyrin repeat protein